MGEHRIRLRGVWDMHTGRGEGETEKLCRVDLPTVWPTDVATRFRLTRRFGRPPFDPDRETARLDLVNVPGLVAVCINGREVARPRRDEGGWSIALDWPLLPRNTLILDVDLEGMTRERLEPAWGSVAVVIAS